MKEKQELMTGKEINGLLTRWLSVLFYAEIATLVMLAVAMIPALDGISGWIGRIVQAAVLVALYQLSLVHERYTKAFLYFAIAFVGSLFQVYAGSNPLTTIASICGLVATYQEYHAHSEILSMKDTYLADKWVSLFFWEMAVGILGSVATIAAVMFGANAGMEEGLLVILGVAIVGVLELPLSLLRLRYLKKMIGYYSREE